MPFKIVQTHEKGESKLTVVPSKWEDNGVLSWPRRKVNQLRRVENSDAEHNWGKMECQVKRSNLTTFIEAEQELDRMCDQSDTEVETGQYFNNVPNHEDMSFDKIVQNCIMPVEPRNVLNTEIHPPTISTSSNAEQAMTQRDNNLDHAVIVIQSPAINTDSNPQQNVTTEVQIDNASLTLMVLEKIETLEENQKTLNEKITENIRAQENDRKFMTESVQSILRGLSDISVQFEHIMKEFSKAECSKNTSSVKSIINSETELNNFEKSLENPLTETERKQHFSIVCGKGKGRGINNAYALVDAMFTRKFLLQCSWAGGSRTCEQKICFKSHIKIINFFFDIIHDSDSSFTLIECYKFFKNILKNSRQRNESKQGRMSRTKNRPKVKANLRNICIENQPPLPSSAPDNRSDVTLPVAGTSVSGPENDDPMSSASVEIIPTEPLETSV